MTKDQNVQILLIGDLVRETLPHWVEHRAAKLGLTGWVKWNDTNQLQIVVTGPEDLIDAFEIACSLGPFDSQIEQTLRCATNSARSLPNHAGFQNLCTAA